MEKKNRFNLTLTSLPLKINLCYESTINTSTEIYTNDPIYKLLDNSDIENIVNDYLKFRKKNKLPLDKNDDYKDDLNINLDSFILKNKIDISDNDLSDNYENDDSSDTDTDKDNKRKNQYLNKENIISFKNNNNSNNKYKAAGKKTSKKLKKLKKMNYCFYYKKNLLRIIFIIINILKII